MHTMRILWQHTAQGWHYHPHAEGHTFAHMAAACSNDDHFHMHNIKGICEPGGKFVAPSMCPAMVQNIVATAAKLAISYCDTHGQVSYQERPIQGYIASYFSTSMTVPRSTLPFRLKSHSCSPYYGRTSPGMSSHEASVQSEAFRHHGQ